MSQFTVPVAHPLLTEDSALARGLASSGKAGQFAVWALGALALVRGLDLGGALLFYALDAWAPESELRRPFARLLMAFDNTHLLQVAYFAATLGFLVWFYRATANALRHLGTADDYRFAGLPSSPGRAVVSFFIPFANFILPYLNMKAVALASDPGDLPVPLEVEDNPLAGYREPARRVVARSILVGPAPLVGWWASWVVGNILARISSSERTLGVLAAALLLVGNVYTLLIVRAIDRLQAERGRRIAALAVAARP